MRPQLTRDDRIYAVRALHKAGFNNREVAGLMLISPATVRRYLAAMTEVEWRRFELERKSWQ